MITITYKSCQGRNTDYLVDSRYEKALEQNKHLKLPFKQDSQTSLRYIH
jgi:hypothetical protein